MRRLSLFAVFAATLTAQSVFINEIHYDNTGTDFLEFVEVAGPAGTSLAGWSIVRYNGSTPTAAVVYTSPTADPAGSDTFAAGTLIPSQGGGFGTIAVRYLANGLQNGPNDAIALVNAAGVVVQFLSYEGPVTASGGPANGLISNDIGIAQDGTEPVGASLALCGTGLVAGDFGWMKRTVGDPGAINACQTFTGSLLPTLSLSGATLAEGNAAMTAFTFAVSLNSPAGVGGVSFTANTQTFGANPATAGVDYTALVNFAGTIAEGLSSGSVTVQVTGDTMPEPDETFQLVLTNISGATPASVIATATIVNDDGVLVTCGTPGATLISQIQGAGLTSPLTGSVQIVEGIVTGDFQTGGLNGFFVQEEAADQDADPATSEGIFIFNTTFPVNSGDKIRLTGTVTEFGTPPLTELTGVSTLEVCSVGNALPAPTPLTLPATTILDLERLEGMRVQLPVGMKVTGNFELGSFGTVGLATTRLYSPTEVAMPGAPAVSQELMNTLSFVNLDDGRSASNAGLDPKPYPQGGGLDADVPRTLRLGDTVDGQPVAIFEQRFGSYRIHPETAVQFVFDNPRPAPPVGSPIRVASFNVLNYFTTLGGASICGPSGSVSCRGASNAAEFVLQRDKIITAINALDAHVVGLIEIENNGGIAVNDLVSGLNIAAGFTKWTALSTGFIGTDSITTAFIYQSTVVAPVGAFKVLDNSVDPRALTNLNRPALAQTFERIGPRADLTRFTVAVNHFKSKGSACTPTDPDTGDGQGNCNLTRVSIANALRDWLATDPTGSASSQFLIVGDLNAYSKEDPIGVFTSAGYRHLNAMFAPGGYSFQFFNASGFLDHMLASPALERLVKSFAVWHTNADEPAVFEYETNGKNASQLLTLYNPDAFRASDHDAIMASFNPLCGDLDDDGDVDTSDLAIGRAALGKPVASVDRRLDFDGVDPTITGRDYSALARCFAAFRAPR